MPFTRKRSPSNYMRKPYSSRRSSVRTAKNGTGSYRRKYQTSKIARFNFSRTRFSKNKYLSRLMSTMNETKLLSTANINGSAAIGQPYQSVVDPAIGYCGYVLQSMPTSWDNGLSPPDIKSISGVISTQGVQANQHIGQYVYYKKTHLSFQVDMNFVTVSRPPIQFRLICGKQRSGSTPTGITDPPKTRLFLKSNGSPTGYLVTGTDALNTFEVMNQPLNKRDYTILRDTRFTLSHPMRTQADGAGVGYSGNYPCRKNFYLNLPHFKKTRLNTLGEPQDYDAHYFVFIFATYVGATFPALEWTINGRGTTSYTDQ